MKLKNIIRTNSLSMCVNFIPLKDVEKYQATSTKMKSRPSL